MSDNSTSPNTLTSPQDLITSTPQDPVMTSPQDPVMTTPSNFELTNLLEQLKNMDLDTRKKYVKQLQDAKKSMMKQEMKRELTSKEELRERLNILKNGRKSKVAREYTVKKIEKAQKKKQDELAKIENKVKNETCQDEDCINKKQDDTNTSSVDLSSGDEDNKK